MNKKYVTIKNFDLLTLIGQDEIKRITELAICFAKFFREEVNIENVLKEIHNLIEIGIVMGIIQNTINDNAETDLELVIKKLIKNKEENQ